MTESGEQRKKLGELLVDAGLLAADKLPDGLRYAREHKLPLGRVLIQWRLLKEGDLESALHSQALMKMDRLPATMAVKAIALASSMNLPVDKALKKLGWQPDRLPDEPLSVVLARECLSTTESTFGSAHPETAAALASLGDRLTDEELFNEAETNYARALGIIEGCFGGASHEMSSLLPKVANLYLLQDRFQEAERLLWRAFEIKERLLGKDHLEVAECLEHLADLYDAQSEYLQAERFYLSCIGIKEKILEDDHPELLQSLKKLVFVAKQRDPSPEKKATGELLLDAGMVKEDKLERALLLAKEYNLPLGRALINMKALTEEDLHRVLHAQVLIKDGSLPAYLVIRSLKAACRMDVTLEQALAGIGWKRENTEEHKLLESLLKASDALVAAERSSGADHPDVAVKCVELADLFAGAGNLRESELLLRRALAIFAKQHGMQHHLTARTLANLAEICLRQGHFKDAQDFLEQALAIETDFPASDSVQLADLHEQFGKLCLTTGEPETALKHFEKSLAIKETAIGRDQPQLAGLIEAIGDCRLSLDRLDEAYATYERALSIREKALSSGNPQVTGLLTKLGTVETRRGEFARAERFFERAVGLTEKIVGENDALTARALVNLADCAALLGDAAKASSLYKRALQTTESAAGPEHESTAALLEKYIAFLSSAGLTGELAKLERRLQQIRTTRSARSTILRLRWPPEDKGDG